MKREKIHCTYLKLSAVDLLNPTDDRYSIKAMRVDRSNFDNIPEYEAGFLRYRAGVFDNNSIPSNWFKPSKSPVLRDIWIISNLYSARNLPSADSNGFSDPKVIFYHLGSQNMSSIIRDTLDPNWSERIAIKTVAVDGYLYPLVVSVYDHDSTALKNSNEFLGYTLINVNNLLNVNETPPTQIDNLPVAPEWYPLSNPVSGNKGKVCISVQLTSVIDQGRYNHFKPMVITKDIFKLKLYILGLRNLRPGGLFAVKNPQIRVNMASVNKGSNTTFADMMTCKPKKGGPDANFNNLIA